MASVYQFLPCPIPYSVVTADMTNTGSRQKNPLPEDLEASEARATYVVRRSGHGDF